MRNIMVVKLFWLLPPYRFTGQLRISRNKFDYKFGQQNIRYVIQKLFHWIHIKKSFQ
jgi:hypothetical protein